MYADYVIISIITKILIFQMNEKSQKGIKINIKKNLDKYSPSPPIKGNFF